jgi:hypothetical protein
MVRFRLLLKLTENSPAVVFLVLTDSSRVVAAVAVYVMRASPVPGNDEVEGVVDLAPTSLLADLSLRVVSNVCPCEIALTVKFKTSFATAS